MAKEGNDTSKENSKDNSKDQIQTISDNVSVNREEKQATQNEKLNRISEFGGKLNEVQNNQNFQNLPIESNLNNSFFLQDDPRISVDFASLQNQQQSPYNKQQDNFMNRTQYDPNQYNRKNDLYSSNFDSKSVYNPNLSTMRFMAEIDLRCDDHLTRQKEDVQADRYCSECKLLVCDSCVIEFHHSHIQSAKTKLEEYFKKQKLELEDMRSKINSSIQHKNALHDLNILAETHEKNVSQYFMRRRTILENLRGKIESLLEDENDLCIKMKENLYQFYKDECYRRMDKPLKELESLLIRLQNFLRDWDTFSRTDKARALKNDQVKNFKDEANELNDLVKTNVDLFRNKSKVLEKNLNEILKMFNYGEKMIQIDTCLFDIQGKVKSSFSQVNKLNFEDLIVEEIKEKENKDEFNLIKDFVGLGSGLLNEDSKNVNIGGVDTSLNMQRQEVINQPKYVNTISNNSNEMRVPNYNSNYNSNNNFNNYNNMNNNLNNNYNNNLNPNLNTNLNPNLNNNNNYSNQIDYPKLPLDSDIKNIIHAPYNPIFNPLDNIQNSQINNNLSSVNPFFSENKHNYNLLIGIKPKSDELIIYDAQLFGFTSIKLQKNFFQDQKNTLHTFPDNCKYVNLGLSILVTGGYINKQVTSNTYLIAVYKKEDAKNSQEAYDVSILPYSKMKEARERHNMIFLADRNIVLVCSGFFNQNAELTDVNSGQWKSIAKMNEVRANATLAYTNSRYVFVIGGFKINEKQQGVYQNSFEVLDMENLNLGWKVTGTKFDQIGINMRLSAMGVINHKENSLLLCGGYDGSLYKKEIHEVLVNGDEIVLVEQMKNKTLPGNYIFLHNNFVRIDNYSYNFDLQMNVIQYDPNNSSFKVNSLVLNK